MAKRGVPTKDKSGYYTKYLRLDNGSYKRIYGKTEKECEEKYEEEYKRLLRGELVKSNKATYGEWVEVWIDEYLINIKESSKQDYINYLNRLILPEFKRLKIQNITKQRVQKWVSSLNEKLAPATVSHAFVILQRSLNDAKSVELIAKNPCEGVKLPKKEPPEMTILTKEEIPQFLGVAKGIDPYYGNVFEFLLLTGMRKGELYGLTFDRFNQFQKTLTIDRQYDYRRKKFSSTKTGKTRVIRLPERAIELINGQIKWVSEERKTNPEFNPNDFIFPDLKGRAMSDYTVFDRLKKAAKAYGKPELRVHDLRHTYATMLLSLGIDVKTVQENLGHKSAAFTLDKYAHSTKEMQELASSKIDDLFL